MNSMEDIDDDNTMRFNDHYVDNFEKEAMMGE